MNEWTNKWMNGLTNEWMNEWMNELTTECINEWKKWIKQPINEAIIESNKG